MDNVCLHGRAYLTAMAAPDLVAKTLNEKSYKQLQSQVTKCEKDLNIYFYSKADDEREGGRGRGSAWFKVWLCAGWHLRLSIEVFKP